MHELLALYPDLRFKLDALDAWTDEVVAELAATGAVDVVDLKGLYEGEWVDATPSAELYGRVARGVPGRVARGPRLNEETDPVLEPHRDRITWDFPIHSVADVDALRSRRAASTRSRRASARVRAAVRLLRRTARSAGSRSTVAASSSSARAGARSSTSPRSSTRTAPNDVAPKEYNAGGPRPGLPQSPLPAASPEPGFR